MKQDIHTIAEIGRIRKIHNFLKEQDLPEKTGILFQKFLDKNPKSRFVYKTWQRLIQELGQRGLIEGERVLGGAFGSTTIISKVN